MSDYRTLTRDFTWRDWFPWLILVRAFRLAWHPGMVGLALVAAVLSTLGWRFSAAVFLPKELSAATEYDASVLTRYPGQRGVRMVDNYFKAMPRDGINPGQLVSVAAGSESSAPQRAYSRLLLPLGGLVRTSASLREFGFYLFGTIFTIAVWCIAGGAITRVALVDLGREEHVSLMSAIRLAMSRFGDYLAAPLYPLAGVAFTTFFVALLGLFMRSDWGAFVASLFWFIALISGMFSALMLLWLAVGWPLMWCAIGAKETGDAFEGMSQSFSFAFSKPLHYLFYAVVAYVLGALAWLLVGTFVDAGIYLARYSASWGASGARVQAIGDVVDRAKKSEEGATSESSALKGAAGVIGFFEGVALAVADAWCYSYFWVLAAGIFLLLRYDTERAELDDVWLSEMGPTHAMPPATTNPGGVAEVQPRPAAPAEQARAEPNNAE
jgi:hypothetical protein